MLTGSTISGFHVGHKIGEGSFGEIYAVRGNSDHILYALKVEPANTARKIIEFEAMVLKIVGDSPYFPKLISSGKTQTHSWYAMELLGPSLSTVLNRLPTHRLSQPTGHITRRPYLKCRANGGNSNSPYKKSGRVSIGNTSSTHGD